MGPRNAGTMLGIDWWCGQKKRSELYRRDAPHVCVCALRDHPWTTCPSMCTPYTQVAGVPRYLPTRKDLAGLARALELLHLID